MSFLIVVAMGLILLAVSFYTYSLYAAAKNWPSVSGTITSVELGHFEERQQYYSINRYYPKVGYSYVINGQTYSGNRASFEAKNLGVYEENVPTQAWGNWKPGDSVTVYYSPNSPEKSVLFPSPQPRRLSHIRALTVSGILLILAGAGVGALNA